MSTINSNGTGPNRSADVPSQHPEGFQGFSESAPSEVVEDVSGDSTESFDFQPSYEAQGEEDNSQEAVEDVSEPTFEAAAEGEEEAQAAPAPRAQKRIRQLAEQKNELSRKNEELLALVEQLKKSNEFQEKVWEKQNAWADQQEQLSKAQQRRNMMLQYGLNPDDTRDAIAFEQMEYKSQLEQQLGTIRQQMEEQQHALQVERFNTALDSSLTKELQSFNVGDDVTNAIRDTAYDIAAIKGLTAREAVQEAMGRYRAVLPRRKAKPQPAQVDAASKAVTMGNRSQGKGVESPDAGDFLSILDSGNFRF